MMQKGDHPNIQYDREIYTYMDREPSDNGINFVLPHVAELDAKKYIAKQLFNWNICLNLTSLLEKTVEIVYSHNSLLTVLF